MIILFVLNMLIEEKSLLRLKIFTPNNNFFPSSVQSHFKKKIERM